MEKVGKVLTALSKGSRSFNGLEFLNETCDKHVKPFRLMMKDGEKVCPRCEIEKANQAFEQQINAEIELEQSHKAYNTLKRKSVLEDQTIQDARFENFIVKEQEEIRNKQLAIEYSDHYMNGETFNIFIQGNQGSGKTHLSYSILHYLNESRKYSCLFVSVEAMIRKIKNSFSDKESKYTEEYFIQLLSSVDYLVLDDIGAETGAIDTGKTATDFVQRVLYAVLNSRQDKSTIVTTNLGSKALQNMYDKKLVSRLLKRPKYIFFHDTKDKRVADLPF